MDNSGSGTYELRLYLQSSRAVISQPLTQAVTLGGLAAGWVWALASFMGDPNPVGSASIAFFSLSLPSYMWRLSVWGELINRAYQPEPERIDEPIELRAVATEGNTTRFLRFPVSIPQLREFYKEVVERDQAPTERILVRDGGLFTQADLGKFRDYLIRYGFAEWKTAGAPQQGWHLNARGRSAIRQMVKDG